MESEPGRIETGTKPDRRRNEMENETKILNIFRFQMVDVNVMVAWNL